MLKLGQESSFSDYQTFIKEVYGFNNERFFGQRDMLTNLQRFIMRGLKGIRKGDEKKTALNLVVALGWFMSLMNRLHINLEQELWLRFPGKCSYCAAKPCVCGEIRPEKRQGVVGNDAERPQTIRGFQEMFEALYPSEKRSLEKAGIHLAEEMGELAESILVYGARGRSDDEFHNVKLEAADLLSCFLAVFNSLHIDLATLLTAHFSENCHVCKQLPCVCSFDSIMNFKS